MEKKQIIYDGNLEISKGSENKLKQNNKFSDEELKMLFNKRNRITLSKLDTNNYLTQFISNNEIPPDILKSLSDYDYICFSLCCSLTPDKDCLFKWVRLQIELSTFETTAEMPIVYDMYPEKIFSEVQKRSKEIKFTPSLKLGALNLAADFKGNNEFILYEPVIFGAGLHTNKVSWDFESTPDKKLCGNEKNLVLVVKAPKDTKIKGKFSVDADIEGKVGGKIFTIRFSKSFKNAVNLECYLN